MRYPVYRDGLFKFFIGCFNKFSEGFVVRVYVFGERLPVRSSLLRLLGCWLELHRDLEIKIEFVICIREVLVLYFFHDEVYRGCLLDCLCELPS